MGARIALGAAVALVIGLAVWAAMPGGAAELPPPTGSLGSPAGLPGPSVAVPAAPAAPAPALGGGSVAARVDACLAAQQKVGELRRTRGGPPPAGGPSDQSIVSAACAPLFAEPGCREAHLHFDAPPPERRSQAVLEACTRGYCAQLAAPKPKTCEHMPTEDMDFLGAWIELRTAILRHDLGDAEAARAFPQR